jgi:hypothetical protein
MSLETLSSRAPSLPMPITQSWARCPFSPSGAPCSSSSSAKASRQAWSSASSASSVTAPVMSDSGAPCSQSSTTSRSITSWRSTRRAAGMGRPRSLRVARQAPIVALTGTPGGRQTSSCS